MTMISAMSNGGCDAVVDALRAEFGAIMAERILEAEAADFLWDARVKERYLEQHFSLEYDVEELSRIAILSVLAGRWHVAMGLVDGEGRPFELLWKRDFDRLDEAEAAFSTCYKDLRATFRPAILAHNRASPNPNRRL